MTTSAHSQPTLSATSADPLICSVGASLAKTFPLLDSARALPEIAVNSGTNTPASLEKSDHDGYWLRMFLSSELGALTSSSIIWKNKGTPLGHSWWVPSMLTHRTNDTGFGSW